MSTTATPMTRTTFTTSQVTTLNAHPSGSILVYVQDALAEAGAADAKAIRWHAQPDGKTLVGEPLDEDVDGRSNPHARSLERIPSKSSIRVAVPQSDVESLGVDPEMLKNSDDPTKVIVLSGDGKIALRRLGDLSVSVDVALPNSD